MLFINEANCEYWFVDIYSDPRGYGKDVSITPLPDCTGWDWKPTPQYRPFANSAEFDPFSDRVVINIGTGTRRRIDHWGDTHVNGMTWEVAFRKYTFLDGTPFGVEVKE